MSSDCFRAVITRQICAFSWRHELKYADEVSHHRERELSYFLQMFCDLSKTKANRRVAALLNVTFYTPLPLNVVCANHIVRFETLIVVHTYSGISSHKPTITILGSPA